MTIGEINLLIQTFQEKEEIRAKEILASNYNLASMIASFISCSLAGKQIPDINELYPTQFQEEKPIEEDKSWMIYKEQMIDFAIAHNKQRGVKN